MDKLILVGIGFVGGIGAFVAIAKVLGLRMMHISRIQYLKNKAFGED